MQKDFHYTSIKLLACKAGFSDSDAQLIAYASQFVDDASIYKELQIYDVPDFIRNHKRYNQETRTFNPICTAYKKLDYVNGLFRKAQLYIFVSFHFLPGKLYTSIDELRKEDFITIANSPLSQQLVLNSIEELRNATGEARNQKLVKLGIALHSFSDTWAHFGFSGIYSRYNDIKNMKYKFDEWNSSWKGYMPDIGHAEAYKYPDISCIEWTYEYKKLNYVNAPTKRENYTYFLDAAKHVFRYLCYANNKADNFHTWDEIKEKLLFCFKARSEKMSLKLPVFRKHFPGILFSYDEKLWMKEALNLTNNYWYYFHIEALNQREYVLR